MQLEATFHVLGFAGPLPLDIEALAEHLAENVVGHFVTIHQANVSAKIAHAELARATDAADPSRTKTWLRLVLEIDDAIVAAIDDDVRAQLEALPRAEPRKTGIEVTEEERAEAMPILEEQIVEGKPE